MPARRARPARAWSSCCATCTRGGSRWSRSRRRPRRRSPPRCCSTTSPPTCTRATRRTPSAAPRRWRSTATCCASCSGQEELRELIDPEALAEVEALAPAHAPRRPGEGPRRAPAGPAPARRPDAPRSARRGSAEGYSAASMLAKLARERRAVEVRIAGEERWIAAEDAALYRDALGVPPPGRPARTPSSSRCPSAMATLVRRYARTHGPFPTAQARRPLRRRPDAGACASSSGPASWSAASCSPAGASASGAIPTSCAGSGGRASPHLRQEAEAVDSAELARFLPAGRTSTRTGRRAPAPTACARRWSRSRASR